MTLKEFYEQIDSDYKDVIKRLCDEDMIKIQFNKNINPLVITPVEGNKFLYLVLPMKI